MAKHYLISNSDGSLRAEVAPAFGGMITQIYYREKPVLHLCAGNLDLTPMNAGGMPLLFPFASKTKDDTWVYGRKAYTMPMHGLLKNEAFAVESSSADSITVWIGSNPAWEQDCYPFRFRVAVTYRIAGNTLNVTTKVENQDSRPMPHALGWHPFFLGKDKAQMRFRHGMQVHYDYVKCVDEAVPDTSDLTKGWDDVFHSPLKNGFTLQNPAGGYEVTCEPDDSFRAMVLCTWVEESVCAEPWLGIPDSANIGRFCDTIAPGKAKNYVVNYRFGDI